MIFTRELLKKLHELNNELKKVRETTNELLRTAQDRFNSTTHKITRAGKEIEITEKVLWDEVFYLGIGSEAGKVLRGNHPEVFESFLKQEKLADELKKFCALNFGFDFGQMTISDYVNLTEGIFMLLLKEKIEGHINDNPDIKKYIDAKIEAEVEKRIAELKK